MGGHEPSGSPQKGFLTLWSESRQVVAGAGFLPSKGEKVGRFPGAQAPGKHRKKYFIFLYIFFLAVFSVRTQPKVKRKFGKISLKN